MVFSNSSNGSRLPILTNHLDKLLTSDFEESGRSRLHQGDWDEVLRWSKTYEIGRGEFFSAREVSDGGYIVAGTTISPGAEWPLLMRLRSNGDVVWERYYAGSDLRSGHVSSIIEAKDGFVVAGFVDGPPPKLCCSDGWLFKVDLNGNVVWQKIYGNDNARFSAMDYGSDGGYVLVGYTFLPMSSSGGAWVVKVDDSGNVLWQQVFTGLVVAARSVQQTSDEGYIIGGDAWYPQPPNFGDHGRAWLAKLDENGKLVWQKTYANTALGDLMTKAVTQTSERGFALAGIGFGNLWVLKVSIDGSPIWQEDVAFSSFFDDRIGVSIQSTLDNGLIVGGIGLIQGFAMKLDPIGEVLWERRINGPGDRSYIYSITQTSDGGFIASGSTTEIGTSQPWIAKLDSQGLCCGKVSVNETSTPIRTQAIVEIPPVPASIAVLPTATGTTHAIAKMTPLVVRVQCLDLAPEEQMFVEKI
jgi:hypothetical protein